MAISGSENQPAGPVAKPSSTQIEVESVKCHSCGFTEECTPAYISRVRDRFQGRWICGLCAEAVKDEVLRSDSLISTEEALDRHARFCRRFRSSSPLKSPTEHPIFAMGRVLRRSFDFQRAPIRTNSGSVLPGFDKIEKRPPLVRSESCFPALSS